MDYEILTDDDKDDIIVNFIRAQERDHYCHVINLQRYNDIIDSIPEPGSPFKSRILTLKEETESRLVEVGGIIDASKPQMPNETRKAAALARIIAKEEAEVAVK